MEWISVKDKLPNEGQKVVMLEPDYDTEDEGIFKDGYFEDYIGKLNDGIVSHWMPINEPPPSSHNSN